jgi:guanylate kinase
MDEMDDAGGEENGEGVRRGLLVVISAPSGAGKSTIVKGLLEGDENLRLSVSMTTRPARAGEVDGVDYRFVDDATFDKVVADEGLAEWANVHDHRYGTPVDFLEAETEAGRDVLLDIDVQGARAIREAYPYAVLIFIAPPSVEELERRLRSRGTEDEESITRRLATGVQELDAWPEYDYLVVNDDVGTAVDTIFAIITAELHRTARLDSAKE